MIEESITELSYEVIDTLLENNTVPKFYNKHCNSVNYGLQYLENNLPAYKVYYEIKQYTMGEYIGPRFEVFIAETATGPKIAYWGMYYRSLDSLRTSGIHVEKNLQGKGLSAILLAILVIQLQDKIRKDLIFGICDDSSDGYWQMLQLKSGRYGEFSVRNRLGTVLGTVEDDFARETTFIKLHEQATGYPGGVDTTVAEYRPK